MWRHKVIRLCFSRLQTEVQTTKTIGLIYGQEMDYYGVWYKGKGKRECPSMKQMMKDQLKDK